MIALILTPMLAAAGYSLIYLLFGLFRNYLGNFHWAG